jgi:mannitol/fructose-specific phosphotransferase system IIA component (Ntr-type)
LIDLSRYLADERVIDLTCTTKEAALEELTRTFAGAREVADPRALLQAVLQRERIVSTGIGLGVAVPHAKIAGVTEFVIAYGRSKAGIPFGAIDDAPVHHIVLIAGPPEQQQRYLQFLATVTLRLKRAEVRAALTDEADVAGLRTALCG